MTRQNAISSSVISGCGYAQFAACSGSIDSGADAAIGGYFGKSCWSEVDCIASRDSSAKSMRIAPDAQFSMTRLGMPVEHAVEPGEVRAVVLEQAVADAVGVAVGARRRG